MIVQDLLASGIATDEDAAPTSTNKRTGKAVVIPLEIHEAVLAVCSVEGQW